MEFKAEESIKNVKSNLWVYLAILIILIIVVLAINRAKLNESKGFSKKTGRIADGNGYIYARGRGNDNDNKKDLLNRIEWATYLEHRMHRWYRVVLVTIIIVALISILAMRKVPKLGTLAIMFVSVFIPIYASQQLYYVHGDIYNDYYIKDNVKRLRKKLYRNAKYEVPPEPEDNLPTRVAVMRR